MRGGDWKRGGGASLRQEGGQCPWLSISPPLLLLNSDPTSSPALPPGQAGAASQLPAALQLLPASNSHHAGGPGSEAKRTLRSRDQEPRPEQAAVGSPNPSTCPAQCLPMGGDAGSGAALSPPVAADGGTAFRAGHPASSHYGVQ